LDKEGQVKAHEVIGGKAYRFTEADIASASEPPKELREE